MTDQAALTLQDGIFALPGEVPTWIWAQTCAVPKCDCRSAFIVATPLGREALLDRARIVQETWHPETGYADVAARLDGADAFHIDIDTLEVFPPSNDVPLDLADHPTVRAVVERMDGEVLDGIGRLWYRGKGKLQPEARSRAAKQIVVHGWRPGELLAYDEALGGVRADLYRLDGRLYEALDLYCVAPGCTCGEVTLDVTTVMARGGPHLGRIVIERSGGLRIEPHGNARERLEQVWAAFQRRHPTYAARLARRDAAMKEVGARIVPEAAPRLDAKPKIGRNDPCPCGSGKKHKKCCGAA